MFLHRIKSLPPDKTSRQRQQKRPQLTPKKPPKPSTVTASNSNNDASDSDFEPGASPSDQLESDTPSAADENEESKYKMVAYPLVGANYTVATRYKTLI